jgi:glycerate 2-kinase
MGPRWSLRKSKKNGSPLLAGYLAAVGAIAPRKLVKPVSTSANQALLCWGKAADDFQRALPQYHFKLIISPKNSDHPLPGPRSFRAGQRIVRFLKKLSRHSITNLDVYLSGGASSLAWIPSHGLSEAQVVRRASALYSHSLDIGALNRERAKLCALKSGGAARMAKAICPGLEIRVFCVSDVAPYGIETLGGGPFFSPSIVHRVLADNGSLRKHIVRKLRVKDCGFVEGTVQEVFEEISETIEASPSRTLVFGCEPHLTIPSGHGRGGRQTHLACLLWKRFQKEIESGELEALCMSSDGVDGSSGGSGAQLSRQTLRVDLHRIDKALQTFNTAALLKTARALVPVLKTATNVQDIVIIKVKGHISKDVAPIV